MLTAIETDRAAEDPPQADPRAKTNPPSHYYQFLVMSFDRATGREIWRHVACEEVPFALARID